MQGESVSILLFLLKSVNVALVVTGEFARLGVTNFGSSDVTIDVVELLANSIRGIGKTSLSLCEKKLDCFNGFLLT